MATHYPDGLVRSKLTSKTLDQIFLQGELQGFVVCTLFQKFGSKGRNLDLQSVGIVFHVLISYKLHVNVSGVPKKWERVSKSYPMIINNGVYACRVKSNKPSDPNTRFPVSMFKYSPFLYQQKGSHIQIDHKFQLLLTM